MSYVDQVYKGGFNFENAQRNQSLINQDDLKKHFNKTGTTIVGVMFDGGVVLAADTRATANRIVVKNCDKIHFISKNITCCGAGTAADCEYVTSSLIRESCRAAGTHAAEHRPSAAGVDFRRQNHTGVVQIRRAHRRLSDCCRIRWKRRSFVHDFREWVVRLSASPTRRSFPWVQVQCRPTAFSRAGTKTI